MRRDYQTINAKLREYQGIWFENIVTDWVKRGGACADATKEYFRKKYGDENFGFSQPFFTGVYNYDNDNLLIMFVGQETNGYGDFDEFDGKEDIELSQEYACKYAYNNVVANPYKEELLYKGKTVNGYSKYAFYNFIRELYNSTGNRINVVWNELDKIHYFYEDKNKNVKICEVLWGKDEDELNKKITDEKPLLLLEIETIVPDLVVFLTGPRYRKSMESALKNKKLQKPTQKEPVTFFDVSGIPCMWTYHPNGLNYLKKWDKVSGIIADRIKVFGNSN